jgi:hypothetical protein
MSIRYFFARGGGGGGAGGAGAVFSCPLVDPTAAMRAAAAQPAFSTKSRLFMVLDSFLPGFASVSCTEHAIGSISYGPSPAL